MSKPSLPQGTRDFNAATVQKRQYIFQTIRRVFELFGFQPLETPAMEQLETLMGKYGEEGDKLIFKILNNGLDNPQKAAATSEGFQKILDGKSSTQITERALRYDLTIPFARYVAMHHGALSFPFKRYQIQPVWRADRPQKGRYREFYQCDADIVGSDSLLNEVELTAIYLTVFKELQLDVEVKINNRKILAGIAEVLDESDRIIDFTVALDKLDKIGQDGVVAELESKGISAAAIEKIKPLFSLQGTPSEQLNILSSYLSTSEIGLKGIEEVKFVFDTVSNLGLMNGKIEFDVTLARGLNYYTGAIFEVKVDNINMGSICGGGRYDDLTATFGLSGVSGVGISFGADRIYDVLEELNLFPKNVSLSLSVLFVNLGHKESLVSMQLAKELRSNDIDCEVYPSAAKLQKQLKYANERGCTWVVIIGEEELKNQQLSLKNMESGEQFKIAITDFISEFSKL